MGSMDKTCSTGSISSSNGSVHGVSSLTVGFRGTDVDGVLDNGVFLVTGLFEADGPTTGGKEST